MAQATALAQGQEARNPLAGLAQNDAVCWRMAQVHQKDAWHALLSGLPTNPATRTPAVCFYYPVLCQAQKG